MRWPSNPMFSRRTPSTTKRIDGWPDDRRRQGSWPWPASTRLGERRPRRQGWPNRRASLPKLLLSHPWDGLGGRSRGLGRVRSAGKPHHGAAVAHTGLPPPDADPGLSREATTYQNDAYL